MHGLTLKSCSTYSAHRFGQGRPERCQPHDGRLHLWGLVEAIGESATTSSDEDRNE